MVHDVPKAIVVCCLTNVKYKLRYGELQPIKIKTDILLMSQVSTVTSLKQKHLLRS